LVRRLQRGQTPSGNYRLLAVDLDGTLIGPDLVVRPAVRDAIAGLLARGVVVVLATGRMFVSSRPFADLLGITAPIICYQGALIRELVGEQRIIRHRPVPLRLAREIARFARERDLTMQVYLDDRAYVARVTEGSAYYAALNSIHVFPVGDLVAFLRRRPTKIVFVSGPEGARPLALEVASRWGGVAQVVQSNVRFVEVTAPKVSKGSALRALARRLGVQCEEIVAIGDQDNDRSLLEAAGFRVAMGNAIPALKAVADLVAPSVEEDGVAWAIREVFGVSPRLPLKAAGLLS
jgi:Cof subfamily protein (haloacid dehalogenase superfamily)